MEADSQILGNKTIENKSILSLNYIYKKIIIKESFENTISELRTLNYEKIAKYKMKNMNIKFLLNSIFKLKKTIKQNNPLLKYIKNVRPYYYSNINISNSEKESILRNIFKINKNSNLPKKEIILNLCASKKNFKNFYYGRMSNIECKRINYNKNEKIILIQKHIRGFLSKKIIDEEVNKIIARKIINKILIIQRVIRKFLHKKKSLSGLIVNIIHNERISKSNKITDIFSLYHYRNLYKKNLIIKKIIKARHDSILLIQNTFKSYIFIKKVKEILKREKKSYVLTYPFAAKKVQIKIYLSNSYKIYDYNICPIRKYFVLYIDKNSINEGEYLCNIIVNDNLILDNRYKYIVDKNNILYNLIYFGEPKLRRPKPKSEYHSHSDKNHNLKIENNNNSNGKEKMNKKEKKKRHKNTINDTDNDFFYYCYNDNSNSTNSFSTKSDHEKNKLQNKKDTPKKLEENLSKNINNKGINNFLNQKSKKEDKISEPKNIFHNFMKKTVNNNKKKIPIRKNDFEMHFKNTQNNNNDIKDNTYFYEINSKKEDSIQSEKLKYINILDELSQSVSSSSKSNFSMKNINSYSKKTHQTKFCSKRSVKTSSTKKIDLNNNSNNNDNIINTQINSKKENIKKRK